jgi:hypothetical protein
MNLFSGTIFWLIGIACFIYLIVIVDFSVRKHFYGHSDPVFFTLLNYSLLFVIGGLLIGIAKYIRAGRDFFEYQASANAALYLIVFILVAFLTVPVHKELKKRQHEHVQRFIQALPNNFGINVHAEKLNLLILLSDSFLEPDLFFYNSTKRNKRIEFLRIMKESIGIDDEHFDPVSLEKDLRLKYKTIRRKACLAYWFAGLYGFISAILFTYLSIR